MYNPYPGDRAPAQFMRDVRAVLADLRKVAASKEVEHVEAARERLRSIDGLEFIELVHRLRPHGSGPDLGL